MKLKISISTRPAQVALGKYVLRKGGRLTEAALLAGLTPRELYRELEGREDKAGTPEPAGRQPDGPCHGDNELT